MLFHNRPVTLTRLACCHAPNKSFRLAARTGPPLVVALFAATLESLAWPDKRSAPNKSFRLAARTGPPFVVALFAATLESLAWPDRLKGLQAYVHDARGAEPGVEHDVWSRWAFHRIRGSEFLS